jgi:phosphopantetheinyl transferase
MTATKDLNCHFFFARAHHTWDQLKPYLTQSEIADCLKPKAIQSQIVRGEIRRTVKVLLKNKRLNVYYAATGRPQVSPNLDISFAHKNDHFFIGICNTPAKIGIDLETTNQSIDWNVFENRFFNRVEVETIHSFASEFKISLNDAFLLSFSAKEALSKAMNLELKPLSFMIRTFDNSHRLKTDAYSMQLSSTFTAPAEVLLFKIENWILAISKFTNPFCVSPSPFLV